MLNDLHPVLHQLQHLGYALHLGQLNCQSYLQRSSQALREYLGCDQVSVWSLGGFDAAQMATCLTRSQRHDPAALAQEVPALHQHQPYFRRLLAQGFISSADTWIDPALECVRQRYLQPGAPRALLDVAFTVNGETFGILCCEELHITRAWTLDELALLRRVGSRVAREIKTEEARLQDETAGESPVVRRVAGARSRQCSCHPAL